MKIVIGADPFGVELKDSIKAHLAQAGHEVVDAGGSAQRERNYYDVAHEVAAQVGRGEVERAVLICGTGMGMAIIANKHPRVFAAVCEDAATATKARSINNANVLTLGAMVTASFRANEIVDAAKELAR